VTNNYNRAFLDKIDLSAIVDEVKDARSNLHKTRREIPDEMATALDFRLELRSAFLRAIELSERRSNARAESLALPWQQMKGVWEQIDKSHHLATTVPEALSTRLQRRLASTMPPRPIVQLSFEDASNHFRRLIADGIDVHQVLDYSDPQSLLVSLVFLFPSWTTLLG
jgi:N-alpha-acetyltransferase 35, NatC auxiliary subunit